MSSARLGGAVTLALTLLAALVLTIMPLPDWAEPFRPDWVALAVIYWCMALPHRVGVFVAWIVGLLLDVATGALLGQHALALAVVAFATLNLHQRLRVFPLGQQALSVLVLLGLNRLLLLWIYGLIGRPVESWEYWLPALTGALLWPWIFVILRAVRRRFDVQ